MKIDLFPGKKLLIILFVLCALKAAFGQEKVLLKNVSVEMHNPSQIPASILKSAPAFGNNRYWILQHAGPLSSKQLAGLKSAGIITGVSLSPQCILASVPTSFSFIEMANLGITGVAPYHHKLAINPTFNTSINRMVVNAVAEYNLLPMPGVKEENIWLNWKSSWGKLQSVWPGRLSKFTVSATPFQLDSLIQSGWVQWIEKGDGELVHFNNTASALSRVDYIRSTWNGLPGLTGKGVTVAVGDGGMVESHADLETHQENLVTTKMGNFGNHQDHVTGTIGGAGLLSIIGHGMAPEARILNTTTSATLSKAAELRSKDKVVLTNNSYGNPLNCSWASSYTATSAFIDDQLHTYTDLLHVFAAGNQGNQGCGGYPAGYRNISEGHPVSKNVLTVGAVTGQDQMAWFSSCGPVKDGRVKPEIVVDGNNIISTVPNDAYTTKGGTSQAAPVVTGTLALLVERYRQLNNNANPESALLKGLLCNSAEDLGLPHVDFKYGYGRANARKARKILENNWFKSGISYSNETGSFTLNAPPNAKGVKVMLVWTDPAAAVGTSKDLVNDLDLNVTNGSGTAFLPWVMDSSPSGVGVAATRQTDTLNNIEQVTLDVSGNENITVSVSAKMLADLNQKYWVVYEWVIPELVITHPINGQNVKSASVLPFRWDISGHSFAEIKIETSIDSCATWTEAATVSNPNALYYEWTLPSIDFQTRWYRLKGNTATQTVYSGIVKTEASYVPVVSVQTCDQTLKLNWPLTPSATHYEVLVLNRDAARWECKAFVTSGSYILNHLENGKVVAVSVKPLKNGKPGLQSDAVKGTPVPGVCPWAIDLGIAALESPLSGRRSTSSDPGNAAQIAVKVQNFSSQPVVDQPVRIFYKNPSGVVSFSDHVISVPVQGAQTIVLPATLTIPSEGQYRVKIWLSSNGDLNIGNDTIFKTIEIYPNPAISLPWQYQAEELSLVNESAEITSAKMGLANSCGLDFNSAFKARLKTGFDTSPSYFGGKSLVLDKNKIDGTTGTGELIFTLNMGNGPVPEELYLDFDLVALGPITTGNGMWVRPNDQSAWIEVYKFENQSCIVGEVKKFRMLNLGHILEGMNLSSSFQIRFVQTGQKPSTISNGCGYAIDNIMLSFPGQDMVMSRLVSPVSSCQDNLVHKVKVRFRNKNQQPLQNVKVGYKLAGKPSVEEIISIVNATDSTDHEFSVALDSTSVGVQDFKIWVSAAEDSYPGNDTLRNQLVFIAPRISNYPYYQGFETNDGYWKSAGKNNSWEWGRPSKNLTAIDTAANGTQIWTTGFDKHYSDNQLSYLQSPCFNLSDTEGDIQFSFNALFNMEQDYDYTWLEVSEDGINWSQVGQMGKGTNWYNHASNNWNGNRKNWEVSSIRICLAPFANKSNMRFRFGFSSDIGNSLDGFGLDDIRIEPAFVILEDTLSLTVSQPTGKNWIDFNLDSGMVASIEDHNLGVITMEMKRNTGTIRTYNGIPYLDRNFLIKPEFQPTGTVKVRLYITDAEVKNLVAADLRVNSFQDLGVFKYDGPGLDLEIENNYDLPGDGVFIPANKVEKIPTAGGYFLEFSVNSFSEFYIASRTLGGSNNPLGVSLLSFTASPGKIQNTVNVRWKTASEVNTDRFELSYSCDGISFDQVKVLAAQGEMGNGYTYSVSHKPVFCPASKLVYRLRQFDHNESKPTEYWTNCATPRGENAASWVANPFTDQLQVHDVKPGTQLILLDASGKVMMQSTTEGTDINLNAASLPGGSYWLRILSETEQMTVPVLKTK